MKRTLTALTLLLAFTTVYGQASLDEQHISHKQFQSVVPQSPNAASLGKYGEVPVGMYTGIPSISIPIYEINTGKLKLPITLSYHAGGIKVEEIASWVGLGWSISTGGQVTRQVRGAPDESANGYLTTYRKIYEYEQMTTNQKKDYLRDVLHYDYDSEPDIFSYSAGSLSGSFFFDTTGNFITIPLSKVSISGVNGFVIADVDGTLYHFTVPETTTSSSISNGALSGNPSSSVSAWLLSKIVSATGTDSINFEYEQNVTNFTSFSSQTKYYSYQNDGSACNKQPVTYNSANSVLGYRLKKILFKNGEILFNKETTMRKDVPDDNALESVVVRSENNSYYKKLVFHHHYAQSMGAPGEYNPAYKEYYRLVLDSISLMDNGATAINKYKFDYASPDQLPNRMSFSQDYWGYFNGANNGNDFVPPAFHNFGLWSNPVYVPGANRNPSESYSKNGTLTSITYPTGGTTTFTYEGNRALTLKQVGGSAETTGSVSVGSTINGGTIFTSDTFTIRRCEQGQQYAAVQVNLNNSNCGNGAQSLECPLVNLVNYNTGAMVPITSSGITLVPVEQTWFVRADLSGVTNTTIFNNFYVQLTWTRCVPTQINGLNWYNSPVGGLRVKSITTYDPVGNVTENKTYEYNWPGSTNTSGYLTAFPSFSGEVHQVGGVNGTVCHYKTISSTSNYPLLATHGSTVGYSYVREYYGTNGQNGFKEYRYISPGDVGDGIDAAFPFPPTLSNEWQRGFPLYERIFKSQTANGQTSYVPVSKKTYDYTFPTPVIVRLGLKAGVSLIDNSSEGTLEGTTASVYNVQAGLFVPYKDTTVQYGMPNAADSIVATSGQTYSLNSFLPGETKTNASGNKIMTNKIIFASDYSPTPASTDPVTLGIRNSTTVTTPIENYTILKNAAGQEFVISGMLTTYLPDKPLPDKVYVLKTGSPIPLASFTPSHINSGGQFIKDSHYTEEVLFNGYDIQGNLKGQQKANDVQLSYLYDYKNSLPTAQVVNAAQEDIAYTSFEADGKGGWTFTGTPDNDATAPTGTKSYSPYGIAITRNLNSGKTYITSFWKNGDISLNTGTLYRTGRTINGWTYVEYEINNASIISITGTGKIDELRLYPKNAQMTTYTYEPLLGITSQSDANGNVAYYEYDTLGRLKLVRDTDKNVIKAMEYKYQAGVND